MLFKRFLIWSSGNPPVQWSRTFKEGIMGNIHMKLYELGQVVQEEMSFKEKVNGWTNDGQRPSTIAHFEF